MSLFGPNSETGGVYRRVNDILYHLERYVKLEVAERLSTLTVIIIIAAVCFVFGTSAIFFLCNALVETLNTITGSAMLSYYIITGALVLIILIVLMLRKPLIEKKVVEYYSKSIIETPSILPPGHLRMREEELKKLAKSLLENELDDYEEEGGES